jgi:hypothetical protein
MIIGLIGEIGVGKTEFCRFAQEYFRYADIRVLNFSDPLKEFAINIGFERADVHGSQADKLKVNESWGVSGREFMQKFGTELCRVQLPQILPNMKLGGSLWVEIMRHKLQKCDKNTIYIIGDCRFKDEVQLVKEFGGKIVKITRNNMNNSIDMNIKSTNNNIQPANHISESGINALEHDILIQNDGSILQYHGKILIAWDFV